MRVILFLLFVVPVSTFGQISMSDQYRNAGQAYRKAAAEACTPSAKNCYTAQANYFDCLADQLQSGSNKVCTTPPSCPGSGCTGGQTGGSSSTSNAKNAANNSTINRQSRQQQTQQALDSIRSGIDGIADAIAARNASRFQRGSQNAARDRQQADTSLADAIEREMSKDPYAADKVGPARKQSWYGFLVITFYGDDEVGTTPGLEKRYVYYTDLLAGCAETSSVAEQLQIDSIQQYWKNHVELFVKNGSGLLIYGRFFLDKKFALEELDRFREQTKRSGGKPTVSGYWKACE